MNAWNEEGGGGGDPHWANSNLGGMNIHIFSQVTKIASLGFETLGKKTILLLMSQNWAHHRKMDMRFCIPQKMDSKRKKWSYNTPCSQRT